MTKPVHDSIRLLTGLGVGGDAHHGVTVKHRSRVARDPSRPNLRGLLHLVAWGKVEREGQVVHIKVDAVRRLRELEDQPSVRPRNFR